MNQFIPGEEPVSSTEKNQEQVVGQRDDESSERQATVQLHVLLRDHRHPLHGLRAVQHQTQHAQKNLEIIEFLLTAYEVWGRQCFHKASVCSEGERV